MLQKKKKTSVATWKLMNKTQFEHIMSLPYKEKDKLILTPPKIICYFDNPLKF